MPPPTEEPARSVPVPDPLRQALALHRQGQLAQARALYEDMLRLQPGHVDALHLLGVIAHETADHQRAVDLIGRALALHAGNAALFNNRGNALQALGRLDAAVADYDRAIAIEPDYAQAHCNRGNALQQGGRLEAAVDSFARAMAIRPDYAEACFNHGNALRELLQPAAAIASYDRAIAARADFAAAWCNRGHALRENRRIEDAIASYQRALALDPQCAFLPGTLLETRLAICDWRGFDAQARALAAQVQDGQRATPPFALLAIVDAPALHLQAAAVWVQARCPPAQSPGPPVHGGRDGRIRVGYYSADFHDHATAHLLAGVFEAHDRSRFELTALSFGPDRRDGVRARIAAAFDRFLDVRRSSDDDVATLSRALGLEIAVDLNGFTRNMRAGIFARRCAPVQVSYLGYPGTMGADYMDYLVADRSLVPPRSRVHYREKIVCLPGSYQANDDRRPVSERRFTRHELGLPAGAFVYCCFNNSHKILPETFAAWMRILAAVPSGVLWLLEDNPAASANLRLQAQRHGVDAGRLVFAPRMPMPEHLARHRAADLFLDTLPYNAHTTASDALWAGLPVLTLIGRAFAGRVAASLLRACGLPELVTRTRPHYEALAIALATDPHRLAGLRGRLADNRRTCALFDTAAFTRGLEAAYTVMAERSGAGLPPAHIDLQDLPGLPGAGGAAGDQP